MCVVVFGVVFLSFGRALGVMGGLVFGVWFRVVLAFSLRSTQFFGLFFRLIRQYFLDFQQISVCRFAVAVLTVPFCRCLRQPFPFLFPLFGSWFLRLALRFALPLAAVFAPLFCPLCGQPFLFLAGLLLFAVWVVPVRLLFPVPVAAVWRSVCERERLCASGGDKRKLD